jgi:hypothetical protein
VERVRSKEDRRVVNVVATREGDKIARSAPSPLQDRLSDTLKRLPQREQAAIAMSLQRIVDLMEADRLEAAPILETDQPDLHGHDGHSRGDVE